MELKNSCLICEGRRFRTLRVLPKCNWPIVKCKNCGFIFNQALLSAEDIAPLYKDGYFDHYREVSYDELAESKRLVGRQYIKDVFNYKQKGRLLELGCASGFLLDEAKDLGFEPFGVEISDQAKKAKAKGHNIYKGVLEEFKFPDNYFDVVISVNTLEHTTDPLWTLKELRRILKRDGICIISVPNHIKNDLLKIGYHKDFAPVHLSYFTPKTFKKLIQKADFKIIKIKSDFFVNMIYRLLSYFKVHDKVALDLMRNTSLELKEPKKSLKQRVYRFIKEHDNTLLGQSLHAYITK